MSVVRACLQLLSQGAVESLVLLAAAPDEETQLHALGAIVNLSTNVSIRKALVDKEVFAALVATKYRPVVSACSQHECLTHDPAMLWLQFVP